MNVNIGETKQKACERGNQHVMLLESEIKINYLWYLNTAMKIINNVPEYIKRTLGLLNTVNFTFKKEKGKCRHLLELKKQWYNSNMCTNLRRKEGVQFIKQKL